MKAYLDNPQLKDDFVAEIIKHREADQIIKGTYSKGSGKNWKGCAVGCSVHSLNRLQGKKYSTSDHSVYEEALGIPEWLARLEDTIFEGLPDDEAVKWPERFAQAVPVGADLEPLKYKFCAFVLKSNIDRVLNLDIADDLKEQVVTAVRGVLNLHEQAIKTGVWDENAAERAADAAVRAWSVASNAERSAWSAEGAARSAASVAERAADAAVSAWSVASNAERSAEGAARSAASAAWSAAWSAEWSAERSAERSAEGAAASVAWSAEYTKFADHLIELLEASHE